MAAGDNHTCFLDGAGIIRCWGWGALGQLGDGDTLNRTAPVQVEGGLRYQWLAAGATTLARLRRMGARRAGVRPTRASLGMG